MIRIEVILPAHLILKTPRTYCPRLRLSTKIFLMLLPLLPDSGKFRKKAQI
jgi:hypothetical protein